MKLSHKSLISNGVVATTALVFALVSPRTVHAFSDEGVTITNTATHPAIVEEVPHLASHLVTLWNWGGGTLMQIGAHGVPSGDAAYVVPTGQSLVITSVEFYPSFPSNSSSYVSISPAGVDTFYANWVVQSNVTTSFQYPSGIVVASGTSLYFSSSVGGFGAYLRGYLTPN